MRIKNYFYKPNINDYLFSNIFPELNFEFIYPNLFRISYPNLIRCFHKRGMNLLYLFYL